MDPLPLRTRRIYSFVSSIVFVVVLAFAILYASGYHIKGFSVVETGAIHVSVPVPDAVVSLNGIEVGRSGLLSRGFFIDNLDPGPYVVEARAKGYHPWAKRLTVVPKIVTEVPAFLIPTTLVFEVVPAFTTLQDDATSTPSSGGGLVLTVEEGSVMLRWTRGLAALPPVFCTTPESCAPELTVAAGVAATAATFFHEGVVYQNPDGIFLAEIDVKEPRLVVPVYRAPGATFRIERNRLYIMTSTSTYEVGEF